jgi:hypothetical protein
MQVPTRWLYWTGVLSIVLITAKMMTHLSYDRPKTGIEATGYNRKMTGFEAGLESLGVKCTWSQIRETVGLTKYDDC